jgi:WD40 repeat protein
MVSRKNYICSRHDRLTAADFQTVARSDWLSQKGFNGHSAKITASAWSPNGAMLATAAADKSLILWETRTQKILKKLVKSNHTSCAPLTILQIR